MLLAVMHELWTYICGSCDRVGDGRCCNDSKDNSVLHFDNFRVVIAMKEIMVWRIDNDV